MLRKLLTIACVLLPGAALSQESSFLHRRDVTDARENLSGNIDDIAEAIGTDPDFSEPRDRALLTVSLAESMARILAGWEPILKEEGSSEGEEFLEDGMVVTNCTGLTFLMAEAPAQVAMLELAAEYWRLNPYLDVPPDLCKTD